MKISKITTAILATLIAGMLMSGCQSENSTKTETPDNKATSASTQTSDAQPQTKHSKADVYTNENGVATAKTESGTEVEITQENLNTLIEEYTKVQGTGSEQERALLDQIQVILETMPTAQ